MSSRPLHLILLAAALLSRAFAQSPVPATDTGATTPPAATETSSVIVIDDQISATVSRDRDTLSVDFPDEEVRSILRNVADLFELNLVVPDTLQGRSSVKLRDVTWRQIFHVVLSPIGYTYVEEGNIIKIVSQESLTLEPTTTEVFVINYARADDLRGSVEPLIDAAAGGRIVVNARSNALVITERPSRLSRIRPIVEQLDKATDQVMIESKFVEVTDQDVKNLGVNWASLAAYRVGLGQISQDYTRSRGQDRQTGSDARDSLQTGVNSSSTTQSGTSRASTATNTTGLSTTGGIATNSGSVTSTTSAGTTSSTNETTGSLSEAGRIVNSLSSLVNTGGTERLASAVFSASDFDLVLSALQTQADTKLVSNPTIVTLNNTEAQINIGSEFPIPNYTYNQERGTFEVSGFTYRPIGIILRVTPQVNAQGFIRLSVNPEVSSQIGTTNFGGASGAEIPIIATRKATTQVSLKDGYTMGIGGLIENSTTSNQSKVPFLGSLPGVGRLFRSDSKNIGKRNLVIFITAKTVSAEGAPAGEIFDPRVLRDMNIRPEDLPGYRDGSDPFAQVEPTGPARKR